MTIFIALWLPDNSMILSNFQTILLILRPIITLSIVKYYNYWLLSSYIMQLKK